MERLPEGHLHAVTYFNLPDAAWDRTPGLHSLDFGLDLVIDGDVWSVGWAGQKGDWFLNLEPGSMVGRLRSAQPTVDATSLPPWAEVIGSAIRLEQVNGCVLRIITATSMPIIVAAGSFVDPLNIATLFGPEILVAVHSRWRAELLNGDASECRGEASRPRAH